MIEIDEEFKNLIPPLKDYEFQQLEENCIKAGRIIEPLKVWNNDGKLILVDGHNRYRIAQEHNLPYTTEELKLESRNDVIVKMCDIQLGRRNLHELDGERLLSRKRKVLEEEAQKRMKAGVKTNPRENFPKGIHTREIIGKELGVSGRQVDKLHRINEMATPQVKDMVRNGTLSVNQAYNSTFPKVLDPVREAKEEHEEFREKVKDGVVDFADVKKDEINQRIIYHDFVRNLYKPLTAVNGFGLLYQTKDMEKMIAKIPDDLAENIVFKINHCIKILESVRTTIERRTNEKH